MKDTKYASLLEAIIYGSIRPRVEEDNERELVSLLDAEDASKLEERRGLSHFYRAMNDGIVYAGVAPDPYRAIGYEGFAEAVRSEDTLVVVSHGWAAPGEWDGAPSECPDRRRVRMTIVIEGLGKFVSIIRFLDEPDEPLVEGDGRGPLRDAIESRILEVLSQMN